MQVHPRTFGQAARVMAATAAIAAFSFTAGIAGAQNYPVKPVRIVVPFAPGGSTDILARIVAQRLTESWGQQVIVDNRAGGGTVIGTDLVAKSPPDGYTMLMVSTSTTTTPALMAKLPYDPLRDLAPVIHLVFTPNVLVVHPSLPAKSVGELIALAKARPGQVAFGSGGIGTSPHLTGEILRLRSGVSMVHVPYKGGGPANIALMSGEISWMFVAILPTLPHIQTGRLRALAVSSARRTAVLPDMPPVAETLPGFDSSPWTGVSVPGGTPRELIARINRDIAKVLQAPDSHERLTKAGNDVVANTPEEFAKFFRGEVETWGKVIREAGIKLH
jgi:tripartite-type tricarboxylate transporter receptor subunit TctC